jgi:hypothetical protein
MNSVGAGAAPHQLRTRQCRVASVIVPVRAPSLACFVCVCVPLRCCRPRDPLLLLRVCAAPLRTLPSVRHACSMRRAPLSSTAAVPPLPCCSAALAAVPLLLRCRSCCSAALAAVPLRRCCGVAAVPPLLLRCGLAAVPPLLQCRSCCGAAAAALLRCRHWSPSSGLHPPSIIWSPLLPRCSSCSSSSSLPAPVLANLEHDASLPSLHDASRMWCCCLLCCCRVGCAAAPPPRHAVAILRHRTGCCCPGCCCCCRHWLLLSPFYGAVELITASSSLPHHCLRRSSRILELRIDMMQPFMLSTFLKLW